MFKASKKRQRRVSEPLAKGTQLVPSAAISSWYSGELKALVEKMLDDYKREINDVFEHPDVQEYYYTAEDASPVSVILKRLKKLNTKWAAVFKEVGGKLAKRFIEKSDKYSEATTNHSLSTMGIEAPTAQFTKHLQETAKAGAEFSLSLISDLQADAHKKINDAVMLSLTSSDPAQQGQAAIIKALNDVGIKNKKRCELIARDQTAKMYGSLNIERMKNAGITHFEWVHSSAGKEPRESHLRHDGKIFAVDDPRLWEVGYDGMEKGDLGPPGWACNCRCRGVPVVDLE